MTRRLSNKNARVRNHRHTWFSSFVCYVPRALPNIGHTMTDPFSEPQLQSLNC